MYLDHWGLKEKPFENTPDPRFLYLSKEHEEALFRMLYVVKERKGAALITGEYGGGKTVLSRALLDKLAGTEFQLALILNPMLSPSQLIREVIDQLGGKVAATASKAVVYNRLNELLIAISQSGKMAAVIVDEAQAISRGGFEEFRLMLNFQLNDRFLLTLVLLGQPELAAKVDKLPQLKQRFALTFHLRALSEPETREYVRWRLSIAGGKPELFDDQALAPLYQFTRGIPRVINNVCDLALLVGSGEGVQKIDRALLEKVVADFEGKGGEPVEASAAGAAV
ncbi:MAG: AAA family ATPase [Candidatus Saganbacteria bacterium]|nr:AAA family ATPase [Candidatus Saganbacteria bacterium]